jgi:hypothetical protein
MGKRTTALSDVKVTEPAAVMALVASADKLLSEAEAKIAAIDEDALRKLAEQGMALVQRREKCLEILSRKRQAVLRALAPMVYVVIERETIQGVSIHLSINDVGYEWYGNPRTNEHELLRTLGPREFDRYCIELATVIQKDFSKVMTALRDDTTEVHSLAMQALEFLQKAKSETEPPQ